MPWDKKGSEYTPVSAEEWLKRAREYRDKVEKERREMMAKYPGRTYHTYPMGSTQETARTMAFQDWFRPGKKPTVSYGAKKISRENALEEAIQEQAMSNLNPETQSMIQGELWKGNRPDWLTNLLKMAGG